MLQAEGKAPSFVFVCFLAMELMNLTEKKVIRSRDIVFMEEKTIVDWETENKSPTTESSRVDAQPNRVEVDLIEIEFEPVDKMNTWQNQEPIEE